MSCTYDLRTALGLYLLCLGPAVSQIETLGVVRLSIVFSGWIFRATGIRVYAALSVLSGTASITQLIESGPSCSMLQKTRLPLEVLIGILGMKGSQDFLASNVFTQSK